MKVNIIGKLKFTWRQLTVDRRTIIFTLLSLVYCVLQTAFAVNSYAINTKATGLIKGIYDSQGISYLDFVHYDSNTGIVNVCQTNDQAKNYSSCTVIWPVTLNTTAVNSTAASTASNHTKRAEQVKVIVPPTNVTITGLKGSKAKSQNDTVTASPTCIQVMKWPLQTILNDTREDLALVFFQLWVFALTILAIVYESIPHLIVSFISHLMVAIWSAFQLMHALSFESDYDILIRGINGPVTAVGSLGQRGACDGQDLLPDYFGPKKAATFVLSIVNFVGFVFSIYFTYKLYFQYDWTTFKRIGASPIVNRCYKLAMILFICIQLSLFFVMTAVGLWVDQLFNGTFGPKARLVGLYRAGGIVVILAIIPWLILGWVAVRREMRKSMIVFMGISVFLVFCCMGQVLSDSWRLTFKYWSFFASMEVVGIALVILTCVFGIVCRIFCFGRGLSQFLHQIEEDHIHADLEADPTAGVDNNSAVALGDEEAGKVPHSRAEPSIHSRADSDETLGDHSGSELKEEKLHEVDVHHEEVVHVVHSREADVEAGHHMEVNNEVVHVQYEEPPRPSVEPSRPPEQPWYSNPWGWAGGGR